MKFKSCLFVGLLLQINVVFGFSMWSVIPDKFEFPYVEKKDSASFAQLYRGYEFMNYSVRVPYLDNSNVSYQDLNFSSHSFLLGGLHFWGKGDFFVRFSLPDKGLLNDSEYKFNYGIATGFRYYPYPLTNFRIRPFGALSFTFFNFSRVNGPNSVAIRYPLQAGVSYSVYPFIVDVGVTYVPNSDMDFYVSDTIEDTVDFSDMTYFFALKFVSEETVKSVNQPVRPSFLKRHKVFASAGPSGTWLLSDSAFHNQQTPFLDIQHNIHIFPEVAAGMEFALSDDNVANRLIIQSAFRSYDISEKAFGVKQNYQSRSVSIDVMKSFMNYHGFIPFIGPSVSFNKLSFEQRGDTVIAQKADTVRLGLVFGWDIIPNFSVPWYLRTTVRYFPNNDLKVGNTSVSFPDFELNFIQFLYRF